jgi:hypothetical protein
MLTWILELPIWPTGNGRLAERIYNRATRNSISVESWRREAIKRALNESGRLGEEVIAAGQLRQGKAPSMIALVSGLALIEMLRPRRSKSLPRQFVLAVTADRVVAFKASGGGDAESNYETRINPAERGSWPREAVRLIDLPKGAKSLGGTLELAGVEPIQVARPNLNGDPNTDELIELLSS